MSERAAVPSMKSAAFLLALAVLALLIVFNILILQARTKAQKSAAAVVNVSGRQRMLSQRIVSSYLYLAWGIDEQQSVTRFVRSWNEFEAAHAELSVFAGNTAAIDRDLEEAAVQWQWFKSAKARTARPNTEH